MKPKIIHTDNSWNLTKYCEDLFGNLFTSTPHRSETNGIAERAMRRIKERISCIVVEQMDATVIFVTRLNTKCVMSDEKIYVPNRKWNGKISGRDQDLTTRTEENKIIHKKFWTDLLQPHFKTHRGMIVKLERFLNHFSIFLPSSRGTQSQIKCVERRIIPCSTEIH